jgi:PTS system fructose-specific IIA component
MVEQLFTINHIILDLVIENRDHVFQVLANKGYELGAAEEDKQIFASIAERETLSTTNVGKGVAIPHAKSNFIKNPALIFLRLKNPIDWEGDDEKVKIVFGILTSTDTGNKHLSILSRLARNLMKDEFLQSLKVASKEKIYAEINMILSAQEVRL